MPTQKAMGDSAVRSQMDLRICFRVRERRDVDLVLGQGMLSAGWDAHKLNAPGKFLICSTEHEQVQDPVAVTGHLRQRAPAECRPDVPAIGAQVAVLGPVADRQPPDERLSGIPEAGLSRLRRAGGRYRASGASALSGPVPRSAG